MLSLDYSDKDLLNFNVRENACLFEIKKNGLEKKSLKKIIRCTSIKPHDWEHICMFNKWFHSYLDIFDIF
jgi:hypothetical protein